MFVRYKATKKPVEVEAAFITLDNIGDVIKWCGGSVAFKTYADSIELLGVDIETLEGTMRANIGDYVIKGVVGEFYPCRAEIFRSTYNIGRPVISY